MHLDIYKHHELLNMEAMNLISGLENRTLQHKYSFFFFSLLHNIISGEYFFNFYFVVWFPIDVFTIIYYYIFYFTNEDLTGN
jgi:hypothetical protein